MKVGSIQNDLKRGEKNSHIYQDQPGKYSNSEALITALA